jgi:hypothetical protein
MDYFTRVATHRDWLTRVLAGRVEPDTALSGEGGEAVRMSRSPGGQGAEIPDTPAGRAMRRLLALIESRPDRAAVSEFMREHTTAAELAGAEFDRRVDVWRRLIDEFEGATMTGIGMRPENGLDVIVQTAAGRRILGIRLEPGTSGRIRDLLAGRP